MEYNISFFLYVGTYTIICPVIKIIYEFQSIRRAALCQLLIHRRISAGHIHCGPHFFGYRLIDWRNAEQPFSLSITLCQLFQYIQHKIHFLGSLAPFADAANTAVIKAVLAQRRCMQIDQYLQIILFSPRKSLIQLFDTSDKGRAIPKNKIRDRDTDSV